MGGLVVLQPQNCLRDRLPREALMKTRRNPNPNLVKSNRRKRSPPRLDDKHSNNGNNNNNKSRHAVVADCPSNSLVMGQVKILKRGEDLNEAVTETAAKDRTVEVKESDDIAMSTANRLGPEPETVSKQVRLTDFYAGTAVIMSPPPSSLPLPGFVTKASIVVKNVDVATDLRRILRLDF